MCFFFLYAFQKNSKKSHKTKSHFKELFFFNWSKSDFSFLELTEHDLKKRKKETLRDPIFITKERKMKSQEMASLPCT